jgi:site-specific recombinase XerD
MFAEIFKDPLVIARHTSARYREERIRYLAYCAQNGYSHVSLVIIARELLRIACTPNISFDAQVTLEQITSAAMTCKRQQRRSGQKFISCWVRDLFIRVAKNWLRFLGRLHVPVKPMPFENLVEQFRLWIDQERGFCPSTIVQYCGCIGQFLRWYESRNRPFFSVEITDIDDFLKFCGTHGRSRVSVKNMASSLRTFFRYTGMKGECNPAIAEGIQSPRVFAQETLPLGPSWADVKRLLASMDTSRSSDIRDRALIMLCAVYGLRASEVASLQLEDIDWEHDVILIRRAKHRGSQVFPLLPVVGNAVIRYLRIVRPNCALREVFLTLTGPFRTLSISSLYHVVNQRMSVLGINLQHHGPHSLRHACAAHLVSEGFSLKEIGDHLGHRSTAATRIYAKVNLPGLREVATFDLGGVL